MNKQLNVVWLFVDGVRRYHSPPDYIQKGDDRSRLLFMDEFSKQSIELTNVVTSAPSTFQSLSAMLTGLDSYIVNRSFADFVYDENIYRSLTSDLRKKGYSSYSFLMHSMMREFMSNFFQMIDRKYWPKGFTHSRYWNNNDINLALENFLNMGFKKPSFIFVDYNCRKDQNTSDKVKWAYNRFIEF